AGLTRFNPCGRIVDWIRRPYRTLCQFNRTGPPAEIQWYEVPEDTPVLGFPSGICSLDWELDPWYPMTIGERDRAPRSYRAFKTPPGKLGGHVCGTPEEFQFGGTYDPSIPPVVYSTTGLPTCCNPARVGRGGAGAGGRAFVDRRRAVVVYGGAGAGGDSSSLRRAARLIYGGAGAGGGADVTRLSIDPTAGGSE